MKILLIGRGIIAKKCLIELYKKDYGNFICSLIGDDEMIKIAKANGLESFKIKKVSYSKRNENFIHELINSTSPEIVFSIQYPWIISSDVIEKMNGQIYNLHNAKLPNYRGHNSISHEILNEEKFHFSTIHKIEKKVDLGLIYFEEKIRITSELNAYRLWLNSHKTCMKIFFKFLQRLKSKKQFDIIKEINEPGRYYKKNEIIDLKHVKDPSNLKEINLKIRAFNFPPHEPAYLLINKTKIYLSLNYDK